MLLLLITIYLCKGVSGQVFGVVCTISLHWEQGSIFGIQLRDVTNTGALGDMEKYFKG